MLINNDADLHNAAMSILVARLCPSLAVQRREISLQESWEKCRKCLGQYQIHSASARRSFKMLERINEKLFTDDIGPYLVASHQRGIYI